MGRAHDGFSGQHPMLQAIESDSVLKNVKLIAEPWDPGPGGYQLGNFAPRWAEWNDQYRDSVRRYWRGDINQAGEFARRIHGSADLFDSNGRNASASVNLVSAHDGFSLADVVSFEERHNSANGENNNDGHAHNYSRNYGVEGETSDRWINEIRRRQRLNMLATLLFSQGTPMLLAGDEFGNSQDGNNNAFAQDNEIGWLDWSGVAADPDFLEVVRRLIRLRRHSPLLRDITYRHGESRNVDGWRNIEWLDADGSHLNEEAWHQAHAFTMLLSDVEESTQSSVLAVAILLNASDSEVAFHLPQSSRTAAWRLEFSSSSSSHEQSAEGSWTIIDHSIACLLLEAG
jgi:glycogen operon protein